MTDMSSLQDNTVNPICKSMLLTLCLYILSFVHLSLSDCEPFYFCFDVLLDPEISVVSLGQVLANYCLMNCIGESLA